MDEPLRILWVCGSPIAGGAERAGLQLAAGLKEAGHSVYALCPSDSAMCELFADHGIPYSTRALGIPLDVRAHWAIRREARRLPSQIALVTTIHEWVWACLGAANPAAVVLVRHMDVPLRPMLVRLANRRADAVIAVSQAVRRTLVERSGITSQLVRVLPNPSRLPPRDGRPDADEQAQARSSLGLPQEGRWVGFFGGFEPAKGLDDALFAVRRASESCGPIHVLVPRRGTRWRSDAAEDRRRLEASGLGDHLHVVGEIHDMQLAFTAVDATLIATRSELSEALPMTAIESLACGVPVVAYGVGGVPEVVGDDGTCGRLAKQDDRDDLARQLADLLRDPQTAARAGEAGIERARSLFAAPRITARYEALFRELAARPSRGVG